MSVFLKVALVFTASITIGIGAFAQDFVPQWNYEAGNSFGALSMSPNAQYIAVQVVVWPDGNPNRGYYEVHLLDLNGKAIWKSKFDEMAYWEILGVSVSDGGDVVVLSSPGIQGMYVRPKKEWDYCLLTLIDRTGTFILKTKVGECCNGGIAISPDGNYIFLSVDWGKSLLLLDRNGKKVWSDHDDNAGYSGPAIAQGGNLIFYNTKTEMVHVWNGQDKKWWTAPCPYSQLCRISPLGQWVATIVESDDQLADAFKGSCENYGNISIYNSHGHIEVSGGRTCTTHDFAVTDNGMVVDLYSDMQPNVYHVRIFDLSKSDVTPLSIYKFETPSGKHSGGSPSLEVSGDGQVVAITTPYTLYYLKAKILEKKW